MDKQSLPNLIFIKGSSFLMGIDGAPENHNTPRHKVTLHDFYISRTVITIGNYRYFCKKTLRKMPNLPSWYISEEQPMTDIRWEQANSYCKWLSKHENKKYRLPTEAEWEFSAKGGIHSKGYEYSGSKNLDEIAWYELNSDNIAHEVAMKGPNELGLFDMSGNVREFCNDWYRSFYYQDSPENNPQGPPPETGPFGNMKVVRGGGYNDPIDMCTVYQRHSIPEQNNYPFIGFRVVMIPSNDN